MVILQWLIVSVGAYFVGSIPFAYLLAKRYGIDVRRVGSRNVGARNVFDVTRRLDLAIVVGILDAAKGAIAVAGSLMLFPDQCYLAAGALFFAVTGHNYPVWLRFHGGRGLATAAGGFLVFHPLPIVFFLLMWLTGYFVIRRNVHVGNVAGALGTPILLWSAPPFYIDLLRTTDCVPSSLLVLITTLVCLQIFIRHLEPIRAIFRQGQHDDTTDSGSTD